MKSKAKSCIPFNGWSLEQIREGRKISTARHKRYTKDERVLGISQKMPWGVIRDYFYHWEGADSPGELQQVIEQIYKRPVPDEELFYLHIGKWIRV